MSTLPLSEVQARLSEIAERVDRTHERVHVTRDGGASVVLLSAQDLASLESTLELLTDSGAVDRLVQAEREVAAGDVASQEQMADLMHRRREREAAGRLPE